MVDYRINLAKTLTSTPEQRRKFYNGMIIYLSVCAAGLVYVAYLMLRQGIENPERRARFGAVYGIVGFISVPLTFLSIRLLRTIHPVVVGSGDPTAQGAFDMVPKMRVAFFFSLITFTFIYGTLLWHRLRLQRLAERVEKMKMELLSV